jgi:2-keto-4-pentenoate hydratase/2-oxohepta-3-ene-1,7-dioic acid hydratase in catechol pathway
VRVASYRDGAISWGVVSAGQVTDARRVAGAPASVREFLDTPDHARLLPAVAEAPKRPLREVELLPPVAPRQDFIALGLNYVQHLGESAAATQQSTPPKVPVLFGKAASSVIGPDAEIRFDRRVTREVDWEVELAVVIGRAGRDIARAAALEHVFGYTVANDVTARDLQFLDGRQWYRGKSLDSFCPLGPWIVTADELGDARGLRLLLRVNGVTKQDATTDELLFAVPEIVASASDGRTLLPGDVILTGTPMGVGFTRTPPEFLKDGDVVEAEIEGIGVLRNTVREVSRRSWSL